MKSNLVGIVLLTFGFVSALDKAPVTAADPTAAPFKLSIAENASQLSPGLQSFAFAQHGDHLFLFGGRTNGFHRTSSAERTFPSKQSNNCIHLLDLKNGAAWKVVIPAPHTYRLRTSNMAYYQDGDYLYLAGGYGSSTDDDQPNDYQTFPHLSVIKLPQMAQAIMRGDNAAVANSIVSINHEDMRVAGGSLKKIKDEFYLVFGQNYDSVYKGGYTGKYTCEIRRFTIKFDGTNLSIENVTRIQDPMGASPKSEFHRRDLNVVDAIRADGTFGITVYGGVFTAQGGPWRKPIYIDVDSRGGATARVDDSFEQRTSQYDCAHLLMYNPTTVTMFTTLFGGISYYHRENGKLVESNADNFMPFVNSITTLIRGGDGTTIEVVHPDTESLPHLIGTDAVFIPVKELARYKGSEFILDFSKLPKNTRCRLGCILGGILATSAQANVANPTFASAKLYDVIIEIP